MRELSPGDMLTIIELVSSKLSKDRNTLTAVETVNMLSLVADLSKALEAVYVKADAAK